VQAWYRYNSSTFLESYLKHVAGSNFMPEARAEMEIMLHTFMLDKAIYELGYELNNRPDWVSVALDGIMDLLAADRDPPKAEKA